MSSRERLRRPQPPVHPERAYRQWEQSVAEGLLPSVDWNEAGAQPSQEWLWSAELAETPGGPELADYVDGMTAEHLDESLVIELIASCERLKSWAGAVQADLLTEIHTRAAGAPRARFVDDEMRIRMGITGYAAGRIEDRARALATAPEVHKALRAGWIDERKADVLLDGTETLPATEARALHRMFIPRADALTAAQLRQKVLAAALAVDPANARTRHEKAKKTRTVSLRAAPDGMAWVSAFLPATRAMSAFTAIDTLAGDAAADDERSIGARRADAFSEVFDEILTTGRTLGGCTLGTRQGARPHIVVTMAASTWSGSDDAPANLAGYGPITAAAAREVAAGGARYTTVITDPADGAYLAEHDGAPDTDSVTAARAGVAAGGTMLRRRLPLLYPEDVWDKERLRLSAHDPRYLIEQVNDATAPHEGPGRDPRGGAGADPVAQLRRLGLRASDSYAPGAELRKHVVLRDGTCRFPGCRVPGWRCQIDHIEPFTDDLPAWAQTVETNLHLLCAHHHQVKTSAGMRVWRDAYGATHWVSLNHLHDMVLPEAITPTGDAEMYRIALEGLKAELGDRLDDLWPQAPVSPGGTDDYDPGNLATEDDLDVIAAKLREASEPAPPPGHANDAVTRTQRPRRPKHPPRARKWLDHVPTRTPPPRDHATGSANSAGDATTAGDGDESDRPPY